MTGIVVVSHSRALAWAAVGLAAEMVHGDEVRIAVAAGLDETTLGTDATAIMTAVQEVDDGSGVVVLMDLGSAVLSAELALELIDPELRERTVLSPAPLVEGLAVAVVAAAGGAGPAEVAAEAEAALAAKQTQLGGVEPGSGAASRASAAPEEVVTGEFEVANPHGLHARPAAALVRTARGGDAMVELRNLSTGSDWVRAGSLSKVATLGALRGHRVAVRASGAGAERAVADVLALAAGRFDEPAERGAAVARTTTAGPTDAASTPAVPGPGDTGPVERDPATAGPGPARSDAVPGPGVGGPFPAAPGVAVGPALVTAATPIDLDRDLPGDPTAARRRSGAALRSVRASIEGTRELTRREIGAAEADIFDAHLLLLDDADLLADVDQRIAAGSGPARAWLAASEQVAAEFAALPDPYLRGRAADVRAVGEAMARELVGAGPAGPTGAEPGILVADDLTPAQVAALDPERVLGIVLAAGSPTGHSAILARARGIPTVVSAGPGVLADAAGARLALDGGTGELVVDPTPDVVERFERRRAAAAEAAAQALAAAATPARTGDGVPILVGANLGSLADAERARRSGADLAGLVRTEFLFLDRAAAPDVDEQVATYLALAEAMGGRRITLRTLDVGGDKPLPYAPQPAEANPFLGVRGIRFALAQRDLLRDQLTAIVRVAHETPVSVMFPMVSTLDEVTEARRRLDEAVAVIGRGVPDGLQVGIMVEVPATALRAASFAPAVDFFSIGTNDLTQYALAAERGNPHLAALADPLDPAVLALVEAVCRAAAGGPLVAVCGELAADEHAARLLVGMGVGELSVAPPAVPAVKQAVRRIATAEDSDLVKRALSAPDAGTVRRLLASPPPTTVENDVRVIEWPG
ncbi:MAG TPA: phosphoenolpyruvate--protein phosphotransferase [Pseudonocardia sp.]|nr:phosphoenolpyruvate--protein phosphotransferase [Pseudonocardia sp.]